MISSVKRQKCTHSTDDQIDHLHNFSHSNVAIDNKAFRTLVMDIAEIYDILKGRGHSVVGWDEQRAKTEAQIMWDTMSSGCKSLWYTKVSFIVLT